MRGNLGSLPPLLLPNEKALPSTKKKKITASSANVAIIVKIATIAIYPANKKAHARRACVFLLPAISYYQSNTPSKLSSTLSSSSYSP